MSLDVKQLVVRRGGFKLRAHFSLEKGKVLVLLGPSGCGKTTLLRALAGLEPIEDGIVALDGQRIENLPPEQRRVGFVFQDLALFERMSVQENIGFSLAIRGVPKSVQKEKIMDLAQRFRIGQLIDRFPSELSGGERQRVALARALAREPALMLLDEPLSALDAPLRRDMRRFMRVSLTESKLTAIHVTHDVEEAADLADEVMVMHGGKIVGRGTMRAFSDSPGSGWLARFMNLGLVLPVRDARNLGSRNFEVSAAGGARFAIDAANVHCSDTPLDACRIYIPFSALSVVRVSARSPKLRARIVRNFAISATQGKCVLELESMEQYFFEIQAENFENSASWLLARAEGDRIELSVDERRCHLIPEDPQELLGRE